MAKILVVEDHNYWQDWYKENLGDIVGKENVNIVDNLNSAINCILQNVYDAYILDGAFPKESGLKSEQLGIKLAKEISEKEGGFDKIRIVSLKDLTLETALRIGIKKVYSKHKANKEKGYNHISAIPNDLKQDLNL